VLNRVILLDVIRAEALWIVSLWLLRTCSDALGSMSGKSRKSST
jgi:hypothetical protein